jgi:PKD repeat protein
VSPSRQVVTSHGAPSWSRGILACLVSLAAGCGGGDVVVPDTNNAMSIRVVEGDGQRGSVGEPLTSPVVVEVADGGGDPVGGVTVEFALTSAGAGAEITPTTALTDADGRAQAHVLLGDKVGLQTGEARVTGGGTSPATSFAALAIAGTGGGGAPVAAFSWDCDDLSCHFSDESTDADGTVTGRLWRFGDGETSTERNPAHDYDASGTYSVTLTVTDDDGSSDITSHQVTATASPPSNASPHAEFAVSCRELACTFTDQSTDADGTVASRRWDFGDEATSTQRNPTRTYAAAGQYTVSLKVTDNDGASDTQSHPANATAPAPDPNDPPHAEFEVSCQDLRCTFVDRSTDNDGTLASWSWDFGDGSSSSERNPSHTYASAGQYGVTLRVTDDDGAADTRSHPANPTAPAPDPNDPPHAEFEVTCQDLRCTFVDRSTDNDGTLASWSWNFGDGTTSSERNPSHGYAAAGHYSVLLVVTDNDGAADTRSHPADPTAPPTPSNEPPHADFDVHCEHQVCAFTDNSKDDDGTIVSRQWDFGDGGSSTEQNPTHTYDTPGHYNVQLTVTDDDGASATKDGRADVKK